MADFTLFQIIHRLLLLIHYPDSKDTREFTVP